MAAARPRHDQRADAGRPGAMRPRPARGSTGRSFRRRSTGPRPAARASPRKNSIWRTLLPPNARPVRSSRLISSRPSAERVRESGRLDERRREGAEADAGKRREGVAEPRVRRRHRGHAVTSAERGERQRHRPACCDRSVGSLAQLHRRERRVRADEGRRVARGSRRRKLASSSSSAASMSPGPAGRSHVSRLRRPRAGHRGGRSRCRRRAARDRPGRGRVFVPSGRERADPTRSRSASRSAPLS